MTCYAVIHDSLIFGPPGPGCGFLSSALRYLSGRGRGQAEDTPRAASLLRSQILRLSAQSLVMIPVFAASLTNTRFEHKVQTC